MKLSLLLFVLLSPFAAWSQNGLSATASGSFGPFGNEVQAGFEYKINRFSLGTGVAYFTSGYGNDSLDIPYPNSYNYNQEFRFRHIMIPVSFAYHVPMGNRFYMVPVATLGISYNLSVRYMSWSDYYENLYQRTLTSNEFARNYRRASIWGGLSLRFAYRLFDRLNIFTAFHAKTTLTAINKNYESSKHTGSGGIAFGLQYNFSTF